MLLPKSFSREKHPHPLPKTFLQTHTKGQWSPPTPTEPLLCFSVPSEWQHGGTPHLHVVCNFFSVREDLGKVLGAQDIPESGLCQETCRWVSVGDVGHGQGCVLHAVIDHTVHTNCHWVLSEDLQHKGGTFTSVNPLVNITVRNAILQNILKH